jgi:hypothetical protein
MCTGITRTTIRLGAHIPWSLQCGAVPVAAGDNPQEPHPLAWLDYINRFEPQRVYGRTLIYYPKPKDRGDRAGTDDGACAVMARAAATYLIDTRRVFSVQGWLGTNTIPAVAELAQLRGVPYLAGGGPREWSQRWRVFHQNYASGDHSTTALLRFIKSPKGLNRAEAQLGVLYRNTPDNKLYTLRSLAVVPFHRKALAEPIVDGQPDFLNQIRDFKNANVDLVFCNCVFTDLVSFVRQADAQGYTPQYTFAGQGADLDLTLRAFGPDSSWVRNRTRGLSAMCYPDHPCARSFAGRLRRVLEPPQEVTQLSLFTAHLAEIWVEALHRVGPNLNRPLFMRALESLDGWTDGLTAPLEVFPDRSVGVSGFAVYQADPVALKYEMLDVDGRPFSRW